MRMNWRRLLRFRHFYHCIVCAFRDSILLRHKVSVRTNTLLLVKVEAIGDYIFFRNFIQEVRQSKRFKNYHITLVGNEIWKDLALHLDAGLADEFIWINKKRFATDPIYRKKILGSIHSKGFETALQANFSREFLWGDSIMRASAAPNKIGSKGDSANDIGLLKAISDNWFTQLITENSKPIFEFNRNKVFFEKVLNANLDIQKPQIILPPRVAQNYIVLFPGAGEKIKQWSTQNFGAWIIEYRKSYDLPIYICGAKSDFQLGLEIIEATNGIAGVFNECGKTDLPALVQFIANSKCLITNDSSAFHIAAATATPCICLLSGRHYGRFAPYPENTCKNMVTLYPKGFYSLLANEEKAIQATRYSSPFFINDIAVEDVLLAYNSLVK